MNFLHSTYYGVKNVVRDESNHVASNISNEIDQKKNILKEDFHDISLTLAKGVHNISQIPSEIGRVAEESVRNVSVGVSQELANNVRRLPDEIKNYSEALAFTIEKIPQTVDRYLDRSHGKVMTVPQRIVDKTEEIILDILSKLTNFETEDATRVFKTAFDELKHLEKIIKHGKNKSESLNEITHFSNLKRHKGIFYSE